MRQTNIWKKKQISMINIFVRNTVILNSLYTVCMTFLDHLEFITGIQTLRISIYVNFFLDHLEFITRIQKLRITFYVCRWEMLFLDH